MDIYYSGVVQRPKIEMFGSQSVWATIIEYPSGSHVFLTVLEVGRFKLEVLAESVSGEHLLPGLQMAVFSLCPHMEKGGQGTLWDPFCKGTNLSQESATLMT